VPVDLSEEELLELVATGEGRTLEFKRGLPRDERLARTLCAFANTRGGWLLVGITDNGGVHGVHHPRKVVENVRRIAREFLSPPLEVRGQIVKKNGVSVVACQVGTSRARPHSVLHGEEDEEIVVRVGASNRIARGPTLAALHSRRDGGKPRNALEKRILAWVERRTSASEVPGGDATVERFAQANNIGVHRARRAFTSLERNGLLLGHGMGARRVFHLP
jgi:predicted HTH transcriptional regulator